MPESAPAKLESAATDDAVVDNVRAKGLGQPLRIHAAPTLVNPSVRVVNAVARGQAGNLPLELARPACSPVAIPEEPDSLGRAPSTEAPTEQRRSYRDAPEYEATTPVAPAGWGVGKGRGSAMAGRASGT